MSVIRLVIADTNPAFTSNTVSFFKSKGRIEIVDICKSGAELVRTVRAQHPDAVLMDTVLEDLDGLTALKRLGGDRDGVLFFLCTEFVNEAVIVRASRYGADGIICKPADRTAIYDTICETVDIFRRSADNSEASTGKLEAVITDTLINMGISGGCIGFRLLRHAVRRVIAEPGIISSMTKQLYPELARLYNTTAACVERNIRSAISRAYSRGSIDLNGRQPTNRELILLLARRIRENMHLI